MINNNATANLIRENRTYQIKSILQTGGGQGQRLLDASLAKLMKDKVISRKEALKHAEEPKNFL
jgi:twitching motility protein PilT